MKNDTEKGVKQEKQFVERLFWQSFFSSDEWIAEDAEEVDVLRISDHCDKTRQGDYHQ